MPDTTTPDDLEGRLTNARDHLGTALQPSPPPFGPVRQRAARRRTQGLAVIFSVLALLVLGSRVATSTQHDGGERVDTFAEEPGPAPTGPGGSDPTPPVEDPEVTAAELWSTTLTGLECMEDAGIGTIGPWPDASGTGVHYEIVLSPGRDMAEADATHQECLTASELLASTFALQESASEQAVLQRIRTDLVACFAGPDVPVARDAELATAVQEHTAEVRRCAHEVSP